MIQSIPDGQNQVPLYILSCREAISLGYTSLGKKRLSQNLSNFESFWVTMKHMWWLLPSYLFFIVKGDFFVTISKKLLVTPVLVFVWRSPAIWIQSDCLCIGDYIIWSQEMSKNW